MIIPKGKWVADGDGWIQTEHGETITEYGGCGSHSSEFETEGVKVLMLAAPEMMAVIRELVAESNATDVKMLKAGTQRGLWDRIAELAARLEHETTPPKTAKDIWTGAPVDATHWGPETADHHASWYKQDPAGHWFCVAVQSSYFPGAAWYGLGYGMSVARIAQLTQRPPATVGNPT